MTVEAKDIAPLQHHALKVLRTLSWRYHGRPLADGEDRAQAVWVELLEARPGALGRLLAGDRGALRELVLACNHVLGRAHQAARKERRRVDLDLARVADPRGEAAERWAAAVEDALALLGPLDAELLVWAAWGATPEELAWRYAVRPGTLRRRQLRAIRRPRSAQRRSVVQ
jgi:hypothetical protein